jgi:hypothetical protein
MIAKVRVAIAASIESPAPGTQAHLSGHLTFPAIHFFAIIYLIDSAAFLLLASEMH